MNFGTSVTLGVALAWSADVASGISAMLASVVLLPGPSSSAGGPVLLEARALSNMAASASFRSVVRVGLSDSSCELVIGSTAVVIREGGLDLRQLHPDDPLPESVRRHLARCDRVPQEPLGGVDMRGAQLDRD